MKLIWQQTNWPLGACIYTSLRWHHSNVSEPSQSDGRLSLQFTPANQWTAGARLGTGVGNAQLCLHKQNNSLRGDVLDFQGLSPSPISLFLKRNMFADWRLELFQALDGRETPPSWIISMNSKHLHNRGGGLQWRTGGAWDFCPITTFKLFQSALQRLSRNLKGG